MLGSSPTSDFSIGDFTSGNLLKVTESTAGAIAGGASDLSGRLQTGNADGGAIFGGAAVWTYGQPTAGGYPMYGDICYGDMPYILRQFEFTGGAVAGGTASYFRVPCHTMIGGALAGGLANYVRVWCQESVGGALGGGWGDEKGDFSKIITVSFALKWSECLFVPPSERWDIPNILRSLE